MYWHEYSVSLLVFVIRFADPSMWTVHVGLTEQPVNRAQSLAVEQIVYHARYRPKGLDYDIALMKLAMSLDFNGIVFFSVAIFQDPAISFLIILDILFYVHTSIHSSKLSRPGLLHLSIFSIRFTRNCQMVTGSILDPQGLGKEVKERSLFYPHYLPTAFVQGI